MPSACACSAGLLYGHLPPRSRPLRPPLRLSGLRLRSPPLAPTPTAGLRYGLRRRSLLTCLPDTGRNCEKAEANDAVRAAQLVADAERGRAERTAAAPAPAPEHPVRASGIGVWIPQVGAP